MVVVELIWWAAMQCTFPPEGTDMDIIIVFVPTLGEEKPCLLLLSQSSDCSLWGSLDAA